jgi:hypothetical protein
MTSAEPVNSAEAPEPRALEAPHEPKELEAPSGAAQPQDEPEEGQDRRAG